MSTLAQRIVIENVLQGKMRGKVAYQGHLPATIALQATYVKPYDDPSGKGYQRPVDTKRCKDFAEYLSKGEESLFTPILLNAAAHWEFTAYDKQRPSYGRLICKSKASLMDGQHRLGGIRQYIQDTNSELNVPFLAFHYLDEDEEIQLFDTINTKAKGIGSSLSKFLRRDSDDLSWVATQLLVRPDSPFYRIGSIIGKRSKGRHITLQNLYKTLHLLTKHPALLVLNKEEKLALSLIYFNSIKEKYSDEWDDYKGFRLTHIVCLDALSIAGSQVISKYVYDNHQVNYNAIVRCVKKLRKIDWSVNGSLRYVKGLSGSKTLAEDLMDCECQSKC
ncbi:DGQHR domain-containing protein [Brevibacillus brevis]|uniref:DGQHR domain-containing protein n=1 Tax=Brevibacillus brevis TaxID=1393 RepID=UPI0025A4CCB4|nr:DGQHR domain-containing protein [Brevibacillus brevis]WJQ78971.1 DGQHR domain-containing protein [Brevibacillus brevis]